MADEIRSSQNIIESASPVSAPVRESQNVVEYASPIEIGIRLSQDIIEIASVVTLGITVTQNIVELAHIPPDISGIYFINPLNSHDIYYIDEKKIPDPTIKTAFLGE